MAQGTDERHYRLVCSLCGSTAPDDGLSLMCPEDHPPALLRTRYADTELTVCPDADGIYRYRRWLPVVRIIPNAGRTVVYHSEGLGRALGLANLWIAFSGYWPERGAFLRTGTFKELEAHTVLGRIPEHPPVLVVPSVGNTAAAFASVFSEAGAECLIIVPERGLRRLATIGDTSAAVRLVSIVDGDYDDAIALAERVSALPGFHAVGGAWNVARRDGLATVLLSAVEAMGTLPEYYFQAVGSAVGALAVHEASERLIASGCHGTAEPRLMMCQNEEFAPVHELWHTKHTIPAGRARTRISGQVYADELVNQRPPYSIHGGIDDALRETKGAVLVSGGEAARAASRLFSAAEGIDIEPGPAVAVACLRAAVTRGDIPVDASVLINITGGGRARLAAETRRAGIEPILRLGVAELDSPGSADRVGQAVLDRRPVTAEWAGVVPDRSRC